MVNDARKTISRYLERHAVSVPEWVDLAAPDDELKICVVIPAYDELGNLGAVIDSLQVSELSTQSVEIIVCVNNAVDSPQDVIDANGRTIELLRSFETPFRLHVIDRSSGTKAFPSGAAGVGQARRLLMDMATQRLCEVGRSADGIIACLDGDSPAGAGYLDDVWTEMKAAPEVLAGVCRYRHPIPDEVRHAGAIVAYETWMRYFEAALHLVDTPYAFQSIGSCMVVSARGYARADGVPPREALSDFYLLQKMVKTGGRGSVIQLKRPIVYPSARPSTRVPRGTGPSVRASMQEGDERFIWVEPPRAFFELRDFFAAIKPGFSDPMALREAASPFLSEILDRWEGWTTIDKLRTHAPDAARFEDQFHTWFDSLKVVKFANRSKEKWGGVFVFEALRRLFVEAGEEALGARIPDLDGAQAGLEDWLEVLQMLQEIELRWHP